MVRLKVFCNSESFAPVIVFQFQYGAIKSRSELSEKLNAVIFQFQYGAIKSYKRLYRI